MIRFLAPAAAMILASCSSLPVPGPAAVKTPSQKQNTPGIQSSCI
jgi:hypothetical protein